MSNHITLSRNELWALLTRTFEALYGHRRDYYDMARSVLWMECHGMDGVSQFVAALPNLEKKNLPKPVIERLSETHAIVDVGGRSLFCLARGICDLALADAHSHKEARIEVENAYDPMAMMGILSYASQCGVTALVECNGLIGVIVANSECPDVYEYEGTTQVRFTCVANSQDISTYLPKNARLVSDREKPKTLFNENLDKGIRIGRSDYKSLNIVADRILVEASEESRRGAGE